MQEGTKNGSHISYEDAEDATGPDLGTPVQMSYLGAYSQRSRL